MLTGHSWTQARQLVQPLRALYGQVLRAGRPVQIRTFHGWFAALLRHAPLAVMEELGLPAQHELLEDDSQARALVWRRFYQALLDAPELKADFEAVVLAYGVGMVVGFFLFRSTLFKGHDINPALVTRFAGLPPRANRLTRKSPSRCSTPVRAGCALSCAAPRSATRRNSTA